jgi:hypothetical protein
MLFYYLECQFQTVESDLCSVHDPNQHIGTRWKLLFLVLKGFGANHDASILQPRVICTFLRVLEHNIVIRGGRPHLHNVIWPELRKQFWALQFEFFVNIY